jgi:hypothetical protein
MNYLYCVKEYKRITQNKVFKANPHFCGESVSKQQDDKIEKYPA